MCRILFKILERFLPILSLRNIYKSDLRQTIGQNLAYGD